MKICYSITPGEGQQVKISSRYALSQRYRESPRKYCLHKEESTDRLVTQRDSHVVLTVYYALK